MANAKAFTHQERHKSKTDAGVIPIHMEKSYGTLQALFLSFKNSNNPYPGDIEFLTAHTKS